MALSVANCCFVRAWFDLLFDANRYFNKLPVLRVELLALAVNLSGFALLVWLGMAVRRRFPRGLPRLVLDLSFLSLLIFPADFIRVQYLNWTDSELVGFLKQPAVMLCLLALAALLIWKHRPAALAVAVVTGITFPLALFIAAKIILLCLNVIPVKECISSPPPTPLLPVRQGQPRVVWIIFDETDYRLTFDQRPAGLELPEFDRFRKESLCADKAYPPGDNTLLSMPALISGRRLSAVAQDGCDLSLTRSDTGASAEWSALPSVFSQARELGLNTALVGWYHPYSRLLGGSLNYCSWYAFPAFEPARATTFGGAIRQQIASLAGPFHVRQLFIDICKDSLKEAVSLVADPTYGLILLHLPPPHGPGVYLPDKNEFTRRGLPQPASYLNNLVLADHELGALRRAIATSGQQADTWVILSADHSWRNSKVYDGRRDYRVPFLVKGPGDGAPLTYSRQFNTVLTSDLILAILRGEITNESKTATWLDAHGKPELPVGNTGERSD